MKSTKLMAVMLVLGMSVSAMAGWTYVEAVDHALYTSPPNPANMYFDADGTDTPVNAVTAWDTSDIRYRTGQSAGFNNGTIYELHNGFGDPAVYVKIDTGAAGTYSLKYYGGWHPTETTHPWTVQTSLDGGATWSEDITRDSIHAVQDIDGQGWVTTDTGLGTVIPAPQNGGGDRGNIIIGNVTTADGIIYVGIQNVTGNRAHLDGIAYQVVPEPATMVLLGLGSLGLLRRKK